jgi:outer membrane protein OmpA-like peptidoglycan-associated protein/osmotically-inducible protein OsmY
MESGMKCNPWRWLWGLIPILMLGWIAVLGERGRIENDLATRTKTVLERSGHSWANIAFDGRDGVLSGKAMEDGEPAKALAATLDTFGVRVVDNRATLVDKVDKFLWSAIRRDGRIRLDGLVPSDKARRDVLGMIKASFPTLEVDDGMKLARGAPPLDVWLGGVGFGLKQLALLKQGRVDMENTSLAVSGDALDAASYRRVRTALSGSLPQGIKLKNESVRPPLAQPYAWSARRQGKEVLLSGHVPNDTVRDELMRAARRVANDAKVVDRMEPASGAPDKFAAAAAALVEQLGALEEGRAEIRDATVSLVGTTDTAARAQAIKGALKLGSLAAFRASDDIKHREPLIKAITPYVTEAVVDKGEVVLRGYVPDDKSKAALASMARQRFPALKVRDELQLGSGQPPGWAACIDAGLDGVRRLGNGRILLTATRLEVSGMTDAETLAQSLPGDVRAKVGTSCDADVRVTLDQVAIRAREEARQKAELERRRQADASRAQAEEAERRRLEEERARTEAERRRAEEAARLKAEEDRRRAEAERRREEEAQRLRAEAEARARRQFAGACQEALARAVREGIINFKRASFDLDPSSYPTLNRVAEAANRCPGVVVEIEGHTDAEGTPERNQLLSDRRANSVREFLTKAGVEPGRLMAIGYGQSRNIAPNDTPENRARNRRIEFTVKTQ